jgi:hypothetical protein
MYLPIALAQSLPMFSKVGAMLPAPSVKRPMPRLAVRPSSNHTMIRLPDSSDGSAHDPFEAMF